MENLQITWLTLLEVLGAVGIVVGGISAIMKLFSPFKKLKERLDKAEKRLEDQDKLLKKDNERLLSTEEAIKLFGRAIMEKIDIASEGYPQEKLNSLRETIRLYFINR